NRHAARNCISERRTIYEQRNQMNKPQFIKRRNINMVEIEDDDDDYWENEVYITQLPQASPYSTNCKEQKEKQRFSESKKEMNL
ncbi:5670_t:CDS:1, partial [Gigaspora margarita]